LRLLPHFLTLLRLLASPFLAWLIVQSRFIEALLVVGFAGVTDWLDGYTARRLDAVGELGIVLDPMADKVMLVTLFFALTYAGLIPFWMLALVMGRDLVIVIGSLLLWTFRSVKKFMPSMAGKVSTFFQIVFVLLVLLHAAFPVAFLRWLEMLALVLTGLFTVWSGYGYVRLGIRLTRRLPA
jgi:cardiolipin synthase (CMP-forming)